MVGADGPPSISPILISGLAREEALRVRIRVTPVLPSSSSRSLSRTTPIVRRSSVRRPFGRILIK